MGDPYQLPVKKFETERPCASRERAKTDLCYGITVIEGSDVTGLVVVSNENRIVVS